MSNQRNLTRQRLIKAAQQLFASHGVTDTTTRQIAELAQVNEVTLFRHFHNKHGLLLAVIEESDLFTRLGQNLIVSLNQDISIEQALKDYATECLESLDEFSGLVRSVVGEAGHYPIENRQALGLGLTRANGYVAQYLETMLNRSLWHSHLSAEKLASLLNGMLLGYAVIDLTTEFHELWPSRADFIESLVTLFVQGFTFTTPTEKVKDLPADLVHLLLQRAKKLGRQEYALVYLLFASGVSPAEIISLEISNYISNTKGQFLYISQGLVRQVPINQVILGKRYGSYTSNPLTKWLKSCKNSNMALFVNEAGDPLSETEINQKWQELSTGLFTPEGNSPTIEQAQQTWCVEMLIRGMSLEDMHLLIGWDLTKLKPYVQRAKEKVALERAISLDI
jgi:AcrR family transcriptional regulator